MRRLDLNPLPLVDDPRFTGSVSGAHAGPPEDPVLHVFVVSFSPGGRTAWHSHPNGQLLICTQGRGWVATRDGATQELTPGSGVWTDRGEEHWHGAGADSPMTHVAVQTTAPDGQDAARWFEAVGEEHIPAVTP